MYRKELLDSQRKGDEKAERDRVTNREGDRQTERI